MARCLKAEPSADDELDDESEKGLLHHARELNRACLQSRRARGGTDRSPVHNWQRTLFHYLKKLPSRFDRDIMATPKKYCSGSAIDQTLFGMCMRGTTIAFA